MSSRPLSRAFYDRDPVDVARDLIGCCIVRRLNGPVLRARIVETEAYRPDDPASHAYRGPTERNRAMFGPPGHFYVYRSHGIHYCLNLVTQTRNVGSAVLVRAAEPLDGLEIMQTLRASRRRSMQTVISEWILCAGPGRLCDAFGIDLAIDGTDATIGDLTVTSGRAPATTVASTRIGISRGSEKPWRFTDPESRFLSRPVG